MAYDFVSPQDIVIPGPGIVLINTLVAVTLPEGYGMILGSRSGMALKQGMTVEAGWIDNDYRGKIGVVLYNHTDNEVYIQAGDRIAQGMLVPIFEPVVSVKYTYPDNKETVRGTKGFGSTGR
jgi:dUTP pyrophosphatase